MIIIKPIKQKWSVGSQIPELSPELLPLFEEYVAKRYIEEFQKIITRQTRMATRWKPLSYGYLKYKYRRGLSLNTWEATGQLKNTLSFKKRSRMISFGYARHKESGLLLDHIARSLEYGDAKIPARPIFRPLYIEMRKHIRRTYNKFKREVLNES